jgi:hypothetical protein
VYKLVKVVFGFCAIAGYTTSERVVDEKGAVASSLKESLDLTLPAFHFVVRGRAKQ